MTYDIEDDENGFQQLVKARKEMELLIETKQLLMDLKKPNRGIDEINLVDWV